MNVKKYTPKLLKGKLNDIFGNTPGIALVYMFGSQITGNTGPMSDLDIAVLWREGEESILLKTCELGNRITDVLNDENIQVVYLNDQGYSFCFNVISTGSCIYGSEVTRVRYETSVLNQYLDFNYFAEQYNRSFKQRILGK